MLRAEAARPPGYYDLIHSHYWLSGQVGWLAKERWGVPLVHTAHTLAKVKNAQLAAGDRPEPQGPGDRRGAGRRRGRPAGRQHADRGARPDRPLRRRPGPGLRGRARRRPGPVPPPPPARPRRGAPARRRLGLPERGYIVAFVGRIQPLKAPDVLLRAAAALRARDPAIGRPADRGDRAAGPSGSGLDRPTALIELAASLGHRRRGALPAAADRRRPGRRSTGRPTWSPCRRYNESFGLVALEAQACGTPVVAAAVGGLVTAVRDGVSGVLVDGHDPDDWARVLGGLLAAPARRRGAVARARSSTPRDFSWDRTAAGLLAVYREAVTEHRAAAAGRRRRRAGRAASAW